MRKELVIAKLQLLASKAKVLLLEIEQGKLWEGELEKGIREISGIAQSLEREVGEQ